MGRIKTTVDGIVSAAMLLASVGVLLFLWQNADSKTNADPTVDPTAGPLPKAPVALAGSATEGSLDAPVAVIVFSDFECPFCRSFGQLVLPPFRDQYISTGKVLLSFRHLPLKMHKSARPAAEAAVCAQEQGKFWTLHDTFFAQPASLRDIDTAVRDIGADEARFANCRTSEQSARAVDADLKLAELLEIRATPTFLVGTNDHGTTARISTRFTGAANYEVFKQKLGSFQDGPGR